MQMCVIQGLFFFFCSAQHRQRNDIPKNFETLTNGDELLFCFVLFFCCKRFLACPNTQKIKKDERDFRFCMQICLRVALHVCTLFCLFALIYTLNITWLVVFCRLIQLHMRAQPSWLAACRRRCHRCRAAQFR